MAAYNLEPWRKLPSHFANVIRERIPEEMQQEAVQAVLWRIMDIPGNEDCYRAFTEWTGDPTGFGPPIETKTDPKEFKKVWLAAGLPDTHINDTYTRDQARCIGSHSYKIGCRAEAVLVSATRRMVNFGYEQFYWRRKLPPPEVSNKFLMA